MPNDDPLARFRPPAGNINPSAFQRIKQSASASNMSGDPLFYTAFDSSEHRQERLEIRQVLGPWHCPSYRYLMDMVYNARQGTELVLVYSFLMVKIAGRNLLPVISAISQGTCGFIQDYDEHEFTPPAPDAPIITKIEIVVRKE